jgi:superfamily II DNA or RNA helicase
VNSFGVTISNSLWSAFRECQKAGIKTALKYLYEPRTKTSCLLSLPTGAGKSGVIAAVSHFTKKKKILVLCDRRAVCDQLYREIRNDFFEKLQPGHNLVLKDVFAKIDDTSKDGIYVSTFQKLQSMSAGELGRLKNEIDLLIVDEGHSEPSPVWSQLSRNLDAHKIIITATPYRNDLFQFDIDADLSYIFTFGEAVEDEVLEEPLFSVINEQEVIDIVTERFRDQPDTICIVKCNTAAEVLRYYTLLSQSFETLALHQTFKNSDDENLKTAVPRKIADQGWKVLVHQRMLDVGVDIPNAKTLILTYKVSSGRELVQTVGRVVRLYQEYKPLVAEIATNSNEKLWNNYRKFDQSLANQQSAKKFLRSLKTAALIDSYLEAFPSYSYFDSSFKKKFNLKEFNPESSLNIPLASVCFVKKGEGFSLPVMLDEMNWEYTRKGDLVERRENCCGAEILLSVSFNNSKLLKDELFFQPSFEVLLVKEFENVVAIYDSRSQKYSLNKELSLGAAVDVDKMLRMASREERTRTKEAHTMAITNANSKPSGVSMKGDDLENTVTNQSHATYTFTTLKVDNVNRYDERRSSYYLGMGSGRVSDQKDRNYSLPELVSWIDDVNTVMNSTGSIKSRFLSSFAKPVYEIPNDDPISILFDFSDLDADLEINTETEQYSIAPGFRYIEYNGSIDLLESGHQFIVTYDEKNERLKFEGDEGLMCPLLGHSWLERLNSTKIQVLYSSGLSYVEGNFYRLTLPSEIAGDISETKLGGSVVSLEALGAEGLSEKDEDNVTRDEFSRSSIFSLIDRLRHVSIPDFAANHCGPFYNYIPDVDLILCTDMGVEHSDFVLSSPDKLVFVHIKCGRTRNPGSAAGSIAEVGGQAIKNIQHVVSQNVYLAPPNLANLRSHWPRVNSNPYLQERVRLFEKQRFENVDDDGQLRSQKVDEVLRKIAERRKSSAIRKEIWVVVGNGFSKTHFINQFVEGGAPAPTSLQAYQFLDSWMATASSMNVEIKFFTSD